MRIAQYVLDAVLAHAREDAPREACGVLSAPTGLRDCPYLWVARMPNVADLPRSRFEFDPGDQLRHWQWLEDGGYEPQVIYHSHPKHPPVPSDEDIRMANEVGMFHLVVSLLDETARLWHVVRPNAFMEETIEVVRDGGGPPYLP